MEKLNQSISLDFIFRDERGENVLLKNYFAKKPVILVAGYYECPAEMLFDDLPIGNERFGDPDGHLGIIGIPDLFLGISNQPLDR